MNFVFRVDASSIIGTGHVTRCLSLAEALRQQGADCHFICREHPGHLAGLIKSRQFSVSMLPAKRHEKSQRRSRLAHAHSCWLGADWEVDADQTVKSCLIKPDWLIVDHYAIDARWESVLKEHSLRLFVIDDLADRRHSCDLLLDQNHFHNKLIRYADKVSGDCGLLLGPEYALLQEEYEAFRKFARLKHGRIRRVMIYFGGADSDNLTGRVVEAVTQAKVDNVCLDVVVSPDSANFEGLTQLARSNASITLHVGLRSLAELMLQVDFAIGACGVTALERCCLGLPAAVISIAENQRIIAAEMAEKGLIIYLGHKDQVGIDEIKGVVMSLLSKPLDPSWTERCREFVDGRGSKRVADILTLSASTTLNARPVSLKDESLLLDWANDPLVRKQSFSTSAISPEEHRTWFLDKIRHRKNCRIYILETSSGGVPIGQVRFDRCQTHWELDFSVDSRFRRRGVGRTVITQGIRTFRREEPGSNLVGRVKHDNEPSKKLFEALGFVAELEQGNQVYRYALCGELIETNKA